MPFAGWAFNQDKQFPILPSPFVLWLKAKLLDVTVGGENGLPCHPPSPGHPPPLPTEQTQSVSAIRQQTVHAGHCAGCGREGELNCTVLRPAPALDNRACLGSALSLWSTCWWDHGDGDRERERKKPPDDCSGPLCCSCWKSPWLWAPWMWVSHISGLAPSWDTNRDTTLNWHTHGYVHVGVREWTGVWWAHFFP